MSQSVASPGERRRQISSAVMLMVALGVGIQVVERWVLPPSAFPSTPDHARIPVPAPAMIYPRELAAGMAFFLAVVFLSLYLYRRRRFIVEWTRGWLYLAGSMLVQSVMIQNAPTRWSVAVSGMLAIANAFTMIKAAATLRGAPSSRRHYLTLGGLSFVWYAFARLILSPSTAFAVAFATLTVLNAVAAYFYLDLARTRRWLGAGAIGLALAAVSSSTLVASFSVTALVQAGTLARNLLLMDMAAFAIIAFGMLALVFEEVAADLARLATTDPLTGCFNRLHWDRATRAELKRRDRFGLPLSVIFIDVDQFKQLNDTAGHAAGDRLLMHVADMLRSHIRAFDVLCRWGGDEFVILMACDEEAARTKSRRLRELFATSLGPAGWPGSVGLSIGVAGVPPRVTDLELCVRTADELMYADKLERGRS